jgi:glycerol kinase
MILAIDQSTSATKALLFDRYARPIDKASREHRQIYPQPGWVEHDAEEIWHNTLEACRELLASHDAAQVELVSLTNQRETLVVFDRQTGCPLHHAIVWQDRRGDELCQRLREDGVEPRVSQLTGLKIDSYFSASKLAWLLQQAPAVAEAARAGRAMAGTIDAYLVHRLTGGRACAADHTNASRTLLFDINTLRWSDELCELFGVPRDMLPELRDSTADFGATTLDGALPRPVRIRGVIGDSQASLLGQCCIATGSAKVTIGTGSSILLNTGAAPRVGNAGGLATVAWTHAGSATYCLEGVISYSAATLAWLKDQLRLIDSAEESETLARSVPDNGGVYLVPAFAGLSAPHWSPDARAAIVGLSGHSTRAHVVRAALESIAYQIHDALDAMRQGGESAIAAIHADGGATRNRLLMQFIADITGIEVRVADVAECSPRGAVLAGLLGDGTSLDEIARCQPDFTTYRPMINRAQAETLRGGWRRAVRQVLAGV